MNLRFGSVAVCAIALVTVAFAGSSAGGAATADVARGKYIVENIGMCTDCHTPRGQGGAFLTDRWLMGSEVEFTPIHPIPGWATVAPAIAGLPSYTDEEAITLLTTGVAPGGQQLAPPMPQFRLSRDDAAAAVAYLRSLAK